MIEVDVLVIGAGPAGMSAAIEAQALGLSTLVIEQRDTIGGAIFRQPIAGAAPVPQAPAVKTRWQRLSARFAASGATVRHRCVFLGVDGGGLVMVEDRATDAVTSYAARSLIIATGAIERILPRPGWQLPGVSTVGGLQVMMKETGRASAGRILLAGNGPLLLAVAAQMARLGNAPVAIVESANPFRSPLGAAGMLAHPGLTTEAIRYLGSVLLKRIPWLRATDIVGVEKEAEQLVATLRSADGLERRIVADRVALHDGIRPNDFGLPRPSLKPVKGPLVVTAGDCREALGAVAAEADGRHATLTVAAQLLGHAAPAPATRVERQRQAQSRLRTLFTPRTSDALLERLTDETVLCRCENRTVGDLRALCAKPDALSGREIKHNGRFAMGACQGRFCAENTARLMAQLRPEVPAPAATDLTGSRWPLRPVSIGSLTRAASEQSKKE